MTTYTPVHQVEKLTRIYSERRERHIAVLIRYQVGEQGGCKIFSVKGVDERE